MRLRSAPAALRSAMLPAITSSARDASTGPSGLIPIWPTHGISQGRSARLMSEQAGPGVSGHLPSATTRRLPIIPPAAHSLRSTRATSTRAGQLVTGVRRHAGEHEGGERRDAADQQEGGGEV